MREVFIALVGLQLLFLSSSVTWADPYHIKADRDWDVFKSHITLAAKYISRKQRCDRDPVDEDLHILANLIAQLVDTPSQRDIATEIVIETASARIDCNDGDVMASLTGLVAMKAMANFAQTGTWTDKRAN